MVRQCKQCSREFESPAHNAVYCSEICRERAKHLQRYTPRDPSPRTCAQCGREFLAKFVTKLCGPACKRTRFKQLHPNQPPSTVLCTGGCGLQKTIKAHKRSWTCKGCKNILQRAKLYGVDRAWFFAAWKAQEGRCACCQDQFPRYSDAHIDHCHTTEAVRGLLCADCNRGLGCFRDSPSRLRAAIKYVSQATLGFQIQDFAARRS